MAGDEICDFIWQHQYNKRWITYSVEEIKIMNKSVLKGQKTVSLPRKDDKVDIIINFNYMYQKNQVSNYEQRIRCVVFNQGFYSWLWQDDDEEWSSFKPYNVFFLEVAYQRKEKVFKFFDKRDYIIDLEKFLQINESTHYARQIIREKVAIKETKGICDIIEKDEAFKKMYSSDSISFQKRWINLPSLSSASSSMSKSSQEISLDSSSILQFDEKNEHTLCSFPVDAECPVRSEFHTYIENGLPFSAILNFTNISANSNKFCIIQILENEKKQYVMWQRLGRTGTNGRTDLTTFGNNLEKAKIEFEAKFFDKTGNKWKDKFIYITGKYTLLNVDLNHEEQHFEVKINLDPSIQSLLEMISNQKVMHDVLEEMSYDSNYAPLGRLTIKQIKEGYAALYKIAKNITQGGSGSELISACDEFYSKIPHNFRRKNPPVIQTKRCVEEKLSLLEVLTNIRIAMKILNTKSDFIEHPLSKYYTSLSCTLGSLDPTSEEFLTLEKCLQETHGPTHTTFKMELIDVFTCQQKDESSFLDFNNNKLLWHGSRTTNWIGILNEGLRIAPSEAPSTGYMFGKGLYFADTSSKSANYCFATKEKNKGLMILCEVSLGEQMHLTCSDESLPRNLQFGCESVFGMGKMQPTFKTGLLSLNAKIPFGPLIENNSATTLQYNEYVVYNENQVKMKYLLRVQFNFI